MMAISKCKICSAAGPNKLLFKKKSKFNEFFDIYRCGTCGSCFVHPQPDDENLSKYYEEDYFSKRTERGYDNYCSDAIRKEIERVFRLNLNDIRFDAWEKSYVRVAENSHEPLRSLDVGCAAGYFVYYMRERGYDARGIEIGDDVAAFGREKLGLNIKTGNFLSMDVNEKFDVITSWASLEHMKDPGLFFTKASEILKPGGLLIISTCRYGFFARLYGKKWRYFNVPEHLFFFSIRGLTQLVRNAEFMTWKRISYGSGLTAGLRKGKFYKLCKRVADKFVKKVNQGDMVVIACRKKFFTIT